MSIAEQARNSRPHKGFDLAPSASRDQLAAIIRADLDRIEMCALASVQHPDNFFIVLTQMLLCVHEDAAAVHQAMTEGSIRALLGLSRGLFETCVNTMRLVVGGSTLADIMIKHANQKFFRDLNRESTIAGSVVRLKRQNADPSTFPDEIKLGMADFTAKSGREKTGWIDESIEDKLSSIATAIGSHGTTRLQLALMGIFRHSSEVIHGSYFGALFSLGHGVSEPPERPSDWFAKVRTDRADIVAQSTAEILVLTIQVVSKKLGIEKLGTESRDVYLECLKALLSSVTAKRQEPDS